MKVNLVATGQDEDCGIATYTTSLKRALDAETNRTSLKLRSWSVGHYVRKAIEAGTSDADVVHVQHEYGIFGPKSIASWPFFLILWVITAVRQVPVVVTMHTTWNEETVEPPLYRLKRLYVFLNNTLIAAVADHVIFLSTAERKKFERGNSLSSVSVVPHGVQTDTRDVEDAKEVFGYDDSDVLVVEPGFVRPQKGYGAFLTVARELSDIEFLVAGGVQDQSHREYADKIRDTAPDNVQISGVLDDERFHAAFAAADIALLPYETVTQSGILNWCLAYELPVVASDEPYFVDLARQSKGVQVFDTVTDAAKLVMELATDEDERRQRQVALKCFKSQYSIRSAAEEHQKLYLNLVRST